MNKQEKNQIYLLYNENIIINLSNPDPFEWYQNYSKIKDIVTQYINKKSKILVVGCGTSRKKYLIINNILFEKKKKKMIKYLNYFLNN